MAIGATRAAPVPKGYVIAQSPNAGVFTGSRRMTLVVSAGPANVAIPAIQNQPWSAARTALDNAGLIHTANPPTTPSETVPAGDVLSVTPAVGSLVAPDTTVNVVLSSGHAPVHVPNVSKQSLADATTELAAAHLTAQRAPADEFSSTVLIGGVIRTSPAIGAVVPYGSTVVVVVSKGPDLVEVPNLFGMTFGAASDKLGQDGFQIATVGSFRLSDHVRQQSPAAFKMAPRGSTVTIGR